MYNEQGSNELTNNIIGDRAEPHIIGTNYWLEIIVIVRSLILILIFNFKGPFSLQQMSNPRASCLTFTESDILATTIPAYLRINRVRIEPPGLTTYHTGWLPWMAILPVIQHLLPSFQKNCDIVYAIDPNRIEFVAWANNELLALFAEQQAAHGVLILPLEGVARPTEVAL